MADEMKYNFYPFNHEGCVLTDDNKAVIRHTSLGHLCGYVAFPNEQVPEVLRGTYDNDALGSLDIHGGLTFAESYDGYSVYGFDCAHLDDDKNPLLRSVNHVMDLTRTMERELLGVFNHIAPATPSN